MASGRPVNIFDLGRALLSAADRHGMGALPASLNVRDQDLRAATGLLTALGYGRPVEGGRVLAVDCDDTTTLANRVALLALAARFDRAFRLPMEHAPGAYFFGAMVSPGKFGITDQDDAGVGGRGASFRQAFESCVGEAAEYLSFIERGDENTSRHVDLATSGLQAHELAWVVAGLGFGSTEALAGHEWIAARSLDNGDDVHVPSELVLRRAATRRKARRMAESTGVAAGPTEDAAIFGGLMEAIERDAVALWWYGGQAAGVAHPSLVENPEFLGFAQAIRGDGSRDWWVIDITTDLDVPAMAAISAERDGSAAVAGFAANVDPRAAIRSALLEMCQMELAQELALTKLAQSGPDALKDQDRVWIARHRQLSTAAFPQFRTTGPAREHTVGEAGPIDLALARLRRRGHKAYVVDLSRPDLAIPVVRVLVPGLQSPKPDWPSARLTAARGGRPSRELAYGAVAPI